MPECERRKGLEKFFVASEFQFKQKKSTFFERCSVIAQAKKLLYNDRFVRMLLIVKNGWSEG